MDAFGTDIDYAVLIKKYGKEPGNSPERRYSPAACVGIEKDMILWIAEIPSTSARPTLSVLI